MTASSGTIGQPSSVRISSRIACPVSRSTSLECSSPGLINRLTAIERGRLRQVGIPSARQVVEREGGPERQQRADSHRLDHKSSRFDRWAAKNHRASQSSAGRVKASQMNIMATESVPTKAAVLAPSGTHVAQVTPIAAEIMSRQGPARVAPMGCQVEQTGEWQKPPKEHAGEAALPLSAAGDLQGALRGVRAQRSRG